MGFDCICLCFAGFRLYGFGFGVCFDSFVTFLGGGFGVRDCGCGFWARVLSGLGGCVWRFCG